MEKNKIARLNFKPTYFYLLILFFFACDNEKAVPDLSGWGYEYFPLERNGYRIYDVSIIDYSILGNIDSSSYLLKEVVSDSFLTLDNEYAYILSRYKKGNSDAEWELDSVWTAIRDKEKAVVKENNVPFVKIVFPIGENKQWDGNKMNTVGEEKYFMTGIGQAYKIGDKVYPETMVIVQKDNPDTLLVRERKFEIYGKNIGLIYKENIHLNYCDELDCIGEGKIESGTKYKQELITHGKE